MMNIYANITVNACKGFISNEDEFMFMFRPIFSLIIHMHFHASPRMFSFPKMHRRVAMLMMSLMMPFCYVYKMYFISHLFLHTITFLLDGLRLRNSKTLHCLVFLLLGFVLMRLLLVLTVWVDQHSAIERVAVSSGTLAGPGNTIHYREGKECRWSLFSAASCKFYCN